MTLTFPNVTGSIEVYMDCLKAICGETTGKSMVDIGCCFAPNTPKLGFSERTYIDVIDRKLDHKDEQQFFYKEDVLSYLRRMSFHRFDFALCLDCIEHLLPYEGRDLLYLMEGTSKTQIIFTPLGDLFINGIDDHDPEKHRSGWKPEVFEKLYYHCIVFPHYHARWKFGAFFAFRNGTMMDDFNRVKEILLTKDWAKQLIQ